MANSSFPGPVRAISLRSLFLVLVVGALIGGVALVEYARFLDVHRSLWVVSTHDRNAHYLYALRLATALRHGEILEFFNQLHKARVWPPLHGLVCGLLLTIGGLDYRLAVLPSLFAWAGAAFFAFLTARRALTVGGTVAGLVAACYLLVSPMHRSFATDIMLESLGACLTMASLYLYLVAVQDDTIRAWRNLALVLTLFFLHKYNYWMIVVLGLVLSELSRRAGYYFGLLQRTWQALPPGVLRRELLHPLNGVILLLALVSLVCILRGDHPLVIDGHAITIYPPDNIVSVAYALFVVQLFRWWRAGRGWFASLDGWVKQLVLWHAWPIVLFLLLPKHLSAFLWFLSPANGAGRIQASWLERATLYGRHAIAECHLAPWSAGLAVALFVLAVLALRRQKAGAQAVVLVALIGALLTATHPNLQGRFLHTWIGTFWLSAAFGVVSLANLPDLLGWRRLAALTAALAALPVLAFHFPGLIEPRRSTEAGPVPTLPSLLDVTDCYARDLDSASKATVLSAVPVQPLAQWTVLEHQGRLDRLEEHWYGFAEGAYGQANQERFRAWLEAPTCDTLVFLDRLPSSELFWEGVGEVRYHAELRELLAHQHNFRLVKDVPFPRQGCRVQVWKRGGEISRHQTRE
jgi:hypothetical protein